MDKTVFFDLETGGIDRNKHPIIQLAAVAVATESFDVLEEFEAKVLFDPEDCNPEALECNAYDLEVWVKEAEHPHEVRRRFSSFLKRHATVKCIAKKSGRPFYVARMAGHNAATFDGPFLQSWYKRADEFLPGYFRVLDTCQLAQWYFLGMPHDQQPKDMKLGTLCEHFGIHVDGELHDALVDIRANVALAHAIMKDES